MRDATSAGGIAPRSTGGEIVVVVLFGAFAALGVLAGLARRRSKAFQEDPNFAPSDHVELTRGFLGRSNRSAALPTETHHDDDPSEFQIGDLSSS